MPRASSNHKLQIGDAFWAMLPSFSSVLNIGLIDHCDELVVENEIVFDGRD
jgi:hypothetical protein